MMPSTHFTYGYIVSDRLKRQPTDKTKLENAIDWKKK